MRARPMVATDRAALMLQLVPYLVGKGEVSIAEAADEFDVTVDQMRSMVEKLTVIGLPGDGGFWQLPHDLFDIDWDLLDERDLIVITHTVALERSPKLSAREAAALLAGLQLARTLPGVGDSALITGLLAKLARGAATTPADVIVASGPVDGVRDVVDDALRRGVAVSFTYRAPDAAATTRTVDPVKVHIASGQWYLQGWCHLREAVRTFHLERVSDVTLTDLPVTHAAEPVPALFEPRENDPVARVRYDRTIAPLLGDYLDRADIDAPDADRPVATIRVADEHSLKRLAARRGGQVEVLEPLAARGAAASWAQAGLAQYHDAQGA
ncbi:helix-turn-helix transcriptional regulator [Microbacterium sp. P06]|uniref:helix-turn-helix transcriptional regulator n=1 Tax=unclassified Microbacterium TaxID=2609290 RepID=UPI0037471F0F